MKRIALAISVSAAVVCLIACKGRTMENMEPSGDTVELTVETDTPAIDSNI